MSDERLHELLRLLPGEDEIRMHAARARNRALARLDEPKPMVRGWLWAPVAVAAVLVVAGFLLRGGAPARVVPVTSQARLAKREPAKLRMKWVLSDGTRVLWTFREDLKL